MTLTIVATRTRHHVIDLTSDVIDLTADDEQETVTSKLLLAQRVDRAVSPPPAKRVKYEHHGPQQQRHHLSLRSPAPQPSHREATYRHDGAQKQASAANATRRPERVPETRPIRPPARPSPPTQHAAASSAGIGARQLQAAPAPSPLPPPQDLSAHGGKREQRAVGRISRDRSEMRWEPNSRPYLYQRTRRKLRYLGSQPHRMDCKDGSVVHVDFTAAEANLVLSVLAREPVPDSELARGRVLDKTMLKGLARRGLADKVRLKELATLKMPGRAKEDIISFVKDIAKGAVGIGQIFVLKHQDGTGSRDEQRNADFFRLLATRQTLGSNHDAFVLGDTYVDVRCGLSNAVEDELSLRREWHGAAGDIITLSWTSDNAFIAGATTHSDPWNQQYNKKGNLMLGSVPNKTIRMFPDHRILRPIVDKGDNATDEMVQSQSPWLYTSVVFSAYDDGIAYTCGFDNTAKIWTVKDDGTSMKLMGTWPHAGKVNYVVPSIHREADESFRMVATAADVSPDAVRVYRINKCDTNISACQYRTFSASRTTGEGSDKWAYCPATMAWGRTPGLTGHLLLVGYSPRSLSDNDNDIPEDKRNSGELRLWDGNTGEAWKVSTASMCNVFEVAWHPNKKVFAAAVSPSGERGDETRTQIRLYSSYKIGESANKVYSEFKCLDCVATGINYGLTIMPYGPRASYVAAGCTDGNTYVWDTEAPESTPCQVLCHGRPILDPIEDLETEDVGVQFMAWGKSLERLYTGSTDGTVKVWNVRAEGNPLVRVLLKCKRAVTSGAFSPDKSKLIIGDASGAFYLLTTHDNAEDEWDGEEETPTKCSQVEERVIRIPCEDGSFVTRRLPNVVDPHPDPPDPTHDAAGNLLRQEVGVQPGKLFLDQQQLVLHKSRLVGAVQGPRYAETGLYRLDYHMDKTDGQSPLLAMHERQQQESKLQYSKTTVVGARSRRGIFRRADDAQDRVAELHRQNVAKSFDISSLDHDTRRALEAEGAELNPDLLEYDDDSDESEDDAQAIDDVMILSE
ncbi:hypothetical protein PpBr36_01838 [Pyricularia pennisetigena]|uniref:hypothetical protein n=1 Tax=Pyricularia pennisetigena TaxID=1578925 RepID=UPI001150F4B3|nr:hypothetical protein PpBr36_01838 [Pyricularia pennisetigena]TLS27756.1 hypothetical protein PpBr36_01838 [Pyricularia pennisetigena]